MDNDLSQIRRWLDEERRDLARFERGARWLMFAVFAGGLLGLAVLASLGCSEDVPRYYAALGDEPTGDSGDSATDAPTNEDPMGSVSDFATLTDDPETTFGNTEPTDAPATDDLPVTDPLPDTGPNPTVDTGPDDTGPDLPSDTGPATEQPDPTSSGPADTGSVVPTDEPEPTGEPEPTVDTTPEPDPACADECCHEANGLRWRAAYWFAADGWYMWLGHNTDVPDGNICEEMAAAGECGITTWRLPTWCEWNDEVVTRHFEPDAPCACTIAWDEPDPSTPSGTKSGICFNYGWTNANKNKTYPRSIVARCAGDPLMNNPSCSFYASELHWDTGAHVMCVADPS